MKDILFILTSLVLITHTAYSQEIYYQQNFEDSYPQDWENGGAWSWGDSEELSSGQFQIEGNTSNFMAFNDNQQGSSNLVDGRLVSETIDLTAVSGPIWLEINVIFPNLDFAGADETFELLYSIDGGQNWVEINEYGNQPWFINAYRLDAIAGEEVQLAFEYDDGNSLNFGVAIDDIVISNELVNAVQKDYKLTVNGGSLFNEVLPGIEYQVDGLLFNYGFETINSFDIDVNSSGYMESYTLDGFEIPPLGVSRYVLPGKIEVGEVYEEIIISISNVNGTPNEDIDISDNGSIIKFDPIEVNPNKIVVVEEATGAWCSQCIRGTIYMDELSKRFGNRFAGVAVHSGDPMVLEEYNDNIQEFPGFFGWPTAIIEREQVFDPGALLDPVIDALQEDPVVRLSLGATLSSGELVTSLDVEFLDGMQETDYQIMVVIVEDDVRGDGSNSYLQTNAYANSAPGSMAGMEYLSGKVSPNLLPYNHVSRALIGSYFGVAGIVSGNYLEGDKVNHLFPSLTMDEEWDFDNLKLVGVLMDSNGEIVNGAYISLEKAISNGVTTYIDENDFAENISIYPNPTVGNTKIKLDIGIRNEAHFTLTNCLGHNLILEEKIDCSEYELDLSPYPAGLLYIKLTIGNVQVSRIIRNI